MRKIISVVFCLLLLFSCSDHRDKYYSDHGEWDDVRLPLIKPYEAIQLNGETGWFVQIQESVDSNRLFSAPNSQRINIVNDFVFLYGKKTLVNSNEADEGWFVLEPKRKLEKGFFSHLQYKKYLDSLGIKEPKLYNIDMIARYQADHDTIDWRAINTNH